MLGHIVNRDGAKIVFRDEGDGPALVLLHGLVEDHTVWDPIAEDLRRDYRVVRPDFRGHGASQPVTTAKLQDLVSDVDDVIRGLQLQQPVLMGHDSGAVVAAICGGMMPLRAIVSVEQLLRFGAFLSGLKNVEPALRGAGFVDALWTVAQTQGTGGLPRQVLQRLRAFRTSAQPALVLSLWEPLLTLDPAELDAISEQIVRSVSVPYLSLHGSDPGPEYRTWLMQRVPSAELEILPDAGHWPQLSATGPFLQLVRDFLGRIRVTAV